MAGNYFTDNQDRVDCIKKNSHVAKIAMPLEDAFGDEDSFKSSEEAVEFYQGALEEIGRVCASEIEGTAEEIDADGAQFKDGEVTLPAKLRENLEKIKALGVFGGGLYRENGGLNMPKTVMNIGLEMFGQACPNTALTIACLSMGNFLQRFATKEQKEEYLDKIVSLEFETSMALTEPNAGSDLGKLRTTAVKEGDHYLLNGDKRFITGGGGHLSFALARTDPNSQGLEGLSVLIVPRHIDGNLNYKVEKIEDKVCLHASPTCELTFENSKGYLLGGEGQGFRVMTSLMNEARTAMGAIAVGISQAALDNAKKYARERVTMGKPIIEHPMVADLLYEMEIEIRAMRSLVAEASAAQDWMELYEKKGDERNFKRWKMRYRRLTPLVKYLCCENAVRFTKNSLQIYGGYGVCKEYPAERFWRESIIYPIYEGTSQIQSLMVLKDTLKDVSTQATGFLGSLAGAWAEAKVTRDPVRARLLEARNELNQAINTILKHMIKSKFRSDIEALKENQIQNFIRDFSLRLLTPDTDLSYPFLCAERLTRIVCDYYALKCMVDHLDPQDKEREQWILEFAKIAIPRMQLENQYMVDRLPSTLDYLEKVKTED